MAWREAFAEVFGLSIRLIGLFWVFNGVRYLAGIFNPAHEWNPLLYLTIGLIFLAVGLISIFSAEWVVTRSYRNGTLRPTIEPPKS